MLSDCQNLNRLTGNRRRLHSAHWLASSLELAARCPVSGCWPSCITQNAATLKRWQENETRFRTLTVRARNYLYIAIPATSAPFERIFSLTGSIFNRRHASLEPEHLNALVFLNTNINLLSNYSSSLCHISMCLHPMQSRVPQRLLTSRAGQTTLISNLTVSNQQRSFLSGHEVE